MTDITIRLLEKNEFPIILPLVRLMNPKVELSLLTERMKQMQNENYRCVAVFLNDEVIGACGIWENTRFYSGRQIEIDNVVISEEYRSQQIGSKMMEWVYDYARRTGCNTVELNTYVSNPRSHKFYYNEGFVILGFHMQKRL